MEIRMKLIDACIALRPMILSIENESTHILNKSYDAIVEEMTEEELEYLNVRIKADDVARKAHRWLVKKGYY